jgi:hypothetical protein
MARPDFFIVGAPKCGTTALFSYLRQHPEVFICAVKEPQFFAEDVLNRRRLVQDWDAYLDCFKDAGAARRVGEASVAYLGSPCAPLRIKEFDPAARIIIMLRNPVDMMHSLYSERVFEGTEHVPDLAGALKADRDRDEGLCPSSARPPGLGYRGAAHYAPQVRRYLDVFGRENVMVIVFEDFQSDTAGVYAGVLRFLDVEPGFHPPFNAVNSNHRARSRRVHGFLEHPPAAFRTMAHAVTTQRLRRMVGDGLRWLNIAYEPRRPLDSDFRKRLLQDLAPEVRELSEVIGRDMSYWCKE